MTGVETAILEGTPGIVKTVGETVIVDPRHGASRPDRLLEAAGVAYGLIERTEVYTQGADGEAVPLLKIHQGKGPNVNKG
jgi:hypothetical protein